MSSRKTSGIAGVKVEGVRKGGGSKRRKLFSSDDFALLKLLLWEMKLSLLSLFALNRFFSLLFLSFFFLLISVVIKLSFDKIGKFFPTLALRCHQKRKAQTIRNFHRQKNCFNGRLFLHLVSIRNIFDTFSGSVVTCNWN